MDKDLQNFLLRELTDILYGHSGMPLYVILHEVGFKKVKIEKSGVYGKYNQQVDLPDPDNHLTWRFMNSTIKFILSPDVVLNEILIIPDKHLNKITFRID